MITYKTKNAAKFAAKQKHKKLGFNYKVIPVGNEFAVVPGITILYCETPTQRIEAWKRKNHLI